MRYTHQLTDGSYCMEILKDKLKSTCVVYNSIKKFKRLPRAIIIATGNFPASTFEKSNDTLIRLETGELVFTQTKYLKPIKYKVNVEQVFDSYEEALKHGTPVEC